MERAVHRALWEVIAAIATAIEVSTGAQLRIAAAHSAEVHPLIVEVHSAEVLQCAAEVPSAEEAVHSAEAVVMASEVAEALAEATATEDVVKTRTSAFIIRCTSFILHDA